MMFGGEDKCLFAGDGFDDCVALAGEVFGDDGANAGVVVADEDGAFATWRGSSGSDDVGRAGGAGKHDVEGGSEAEVALRPDGAAVLLDDAAADREAEAGAALLAGVGGFDLLEAVEDAVELVGGDAAAFVDDFQEDGVGGGFGVDANGGGDRRELDRVGEQVGEDLKDAVGVAVEEESFGIGDMGDGGWFEREMDGVGVGHWGHGVDGLLGEVAEGAATDLRGARPDSMRSRSRMSLMRRMRRSVLVTAMRRRFSALASTSPMMPEESRPRAPRMLVSGVRSSCETVEMNSSLRVSSSERWVS